MLQNSPQFMVEINLEGKIKYMNEFAISRLKLLPKDRLINSSWFDLITSQEDRCRIKSSFKRFIDHEKDTFPSYKGVFCSSDGEEITVDWLNFNIYNQQGDIDGIMLLGQDLTEHEFAVVEISLLKAEIEKETLTANLQATSTTSSRIIGTGKAISYAVFCLKKKNSTTATVLLEGETGVRKELFADLIHESRSR